MMRPIRFLVVACAAFFASVTSASAQGYPPAMPVGPDYGPPPYVMSGAGSNVVNYNVGRHKSYWNGAQPVEAFLKQVGRRSWLRLEYLYWDIEDPSNRPIGAPTDGVGSDPFSVVDLATGDDSLGFAIVPGFDNLTLDGNSGIRGTYGMWFNGGSLEVSVFGTNQASSELNFGNLQANRPEAPDPADPDPETVSAALGTENNPNIIIPLTVDGVPGTEDSLAFIGFDSSYRAELRSQIWGAELNVLTEPQASLDQITWQWLGGIRYFNFDESFSQTGVRDGAGAIAPVTTRIRASTTNNIYGPTAGFRAQYSNKYLTLSATPQITFGLNDYTTRLATSGNQFSTTGMADEEEIDFTTLTQVKLLAEVHVSERFTLYGGYDFLWAYRAARPFRSINYDSQLAVDSVDPLISLRPDPESLAIQGFSFGATLRF